MLSYHVIPSGAVYSANLTDGQQVPTALAGADPLTVALTNGSVIFEGAQNNATVTVPNIKAGKSVIHVVNDVLLPAGVGNSTNATSGVAGGSAAAAAPGTTTSTSDVNSGTAVGGGASTNAPAPAAAKGAAGVAKVPAVLLASMLLIGMLL